MIHCNNCQDPQMCMERGACRAKEQYYGSGEENGYTLGPDFVETIKQMDERYVVEKKRIEKEIAAWRPSGWHGSVNAFTDKNGIDIIN